MYKVRYSKRFSKSLFRLIKGGLKKSVLGKIQDVIESLALGEKLEARYKDHQLHGEFAEYRECHIQGDLLLMYRIIDAELVLVLVNIGSHNDLF